MDEMIKQVSVIDNALGEIARQRDKLLIKAPVLSSGRQAALHECVATEFPVEAALRETAAQRDQLLEFPPGIPVAAELTLRQLVAAELKDGGASEPKVRVPVWLRFFRSPIGSLTVCATITAAILYIGRWETPSRHNEESFLHISRTERVNLEAAVMLDRSPSERAELFARKASIGPFSLSTSEPASLQASFLANGSLHEAPLGLRLDLPVRAILTDDGLARTP
jgi:hypothetical protein